MKILLPIVSSACLALAVSAASAAEGGWTVLFDGKSTEHFRGYKQKSFPTNNWKVEDGTLHCLPKGGPDLVTVEKYESFDLEFEWKVSPGGNSGVMYRVAETQGAPYQTGPEYQVLDDSKHGDGKNPKTSAGALYALIAPNQAKTLKPVGEWNSSRIVVNKSHVEHWLNGAKVVEYQWGSPEVKDLVAKSKFKGWPTFMGETTGHIDFQAHGQEVWYRNIRVKRL
jgi:hypothetical protein